MTKIVAVIPPDPTYDELRAEVARLRAHLQAEVKERHDALAEARTTYSELNAECKAHGIELIEARAEVERLRAALDTLALALTEHHHQWTDHERKMYENATSDRLSAGIAPRTD